MKITKLASLVVVAVLTLSACSSNESILPVEESENALKSYKIKRDATGAYSIDLDVNENVKTQAFKNEETNKNEFHFYESDNQSSKKQSKELFTTYTSSDRPQPNDGPGSPPWRGEGDGAPPVPIKPRPEDAIEMFGWTLFIVVAIASTLLLRSQQTSSA